MAGRSWCETAQVIGALFPTIVAHGKWDRPLLSEPQVDRPGVPVELRVARHGRSEASQHSDYYRRRPKRRCRKRIARRSEEARRVVGGTASDWGAVLSGWK
ncbi:hypothetical protein V496_09799 [Pseudogymnoascus sp. VKM F-4515 (FW-2607)]|nr:hypothetical protein V496_09799 [Pseudogymnoascus sp. VKM F-4515 (FW-2607)]